MQGVKSTVFRDADGGEEHDTSQTSTSQIGDVPRSMGRDSFSEIGVSIVLVNLSCRVAEQRYVKSWLMMSSQIFFTLAAGIQESNSGP